jgi:hypothetical protein
MKIFFTISNSNESVHFGGVSDVIGCSMDICESEFPPEVIDFLERKIECRKKGLINLESMQLSYENPKPLKTLLPNKQCY